jgi:hypothetical protein
MFSRPANVHIKRTKRVHVHKWLRSLGFGWFVGCVHSQVAVPCSAGKDRKEVNNREIEKQSLGKTIFWGSVGSG